MKKLVLCIVVLSMLVSSGCTVKKDFVFDIVKEFVVIYGSNTYSMQDDVDATSSSSDFETYKDDIDNIEIQNATYTVTYFHGSSTQTITNSTVKVGNISGSTPSLIAEVNNVNLLSVSARETNLPINSVGQQKFVDLLRNSPYKARLYYEGTANESPLNFKVKFKFQVKVTYKKSLI